MCSAGTLSAFSQEIIIFSICCSNGKVLLHFLKDNLTAIAYHRDKATFTDCYPRRDAEGRAQLATAS